MEEFPPVLMSWSAFAPKLILRAKGDVGDWDAGASPSSTAHSSIEEFGELVLPKLGSRLFGKDEDDVGEPARPARDVLRRC